MKTITMYVTFDNVKHASQKAATHHLDVLYADKLSKLSSRLLQEGNCKHVGTRDFIDDNLNLFAELQRIKDDMILAQVDDNED